jgi:bifunctional non-homologous end joining protein LigD
MSLGKYISKRNFDHTPEPSGKTKKAGDGLLFVVQRHHASHLHYDFRLEVGGVLKSWAIPKGPSMNPKDKRLAMIVEDHPIEYATFEGEIPPGNYGAGRVDIWDNGSYTPINENGAIISESEFEMRLEDGHAKFILNGKILKGEFALVNMRKDGKSWLLMKHNDEYAIGEDYDSEDYAPKSALAYSSGR